MGYHSQGQCVDTVQAAASLQCASFPKTSTEGGVVNAWSCAGPSLDGQTLNLLHTSSAASEPVAQTLAVSFPTCDPLQQHKDLSELWGLYLAAAAGIWCLKQFVLRLVSNQ